MDAFWLALASLIVVIGPWKAGIVFAERTAPLPLAIRRLVAVATVGIGLIVAVVFVLIGAEIVEFFHIDEAAFLIAAGLLVLVFAIRMVILDEHEGSTPEAVDDVAPRERAWRLAAYPLAVPLLVTPPAIAVLVALAVQAEVSDSSMMGLLAAIGVVMVLNLGVLLAEAQWGSIIPAQAWSIAGRVFGVLLAAFGMSIIIEGVKASGLVAGA
jgi:multiple antibiotic resistance protein